MGYASYPYGISLDPRTSYDFHLDRADTIDSWPSLSIQDLRTDFYGNLFAGTSDGVGKIITNNDGTVDSYFKFEDANLVSGGIPAIVTYDIDSNTLVAVSGIETVSTSSGDEKSGTGISWSLNNGETWNYIEQPIDAYPDCSQYLECEDPLTCECRPAATGCSWDVPSETCVYQGAYIPFEWYGQTLFHEPIPITIRNISYDISVDTSQHYIYAASWAGSLRRFNYLDEEPQWELVPLPMNTQDSLICGEVPSNYYYNPIDGQGFHNHKGFSVHVEGNIIWAGTADGVNKGLIREDGCIDWYHYTFPSDENIENDIDGNWIIGIIPNYTTDEYGNIVTRIWLVSWTLTGPAPHNLYYTDNEGETWNKISDLVDEGAIAYDISIYTFGGTFGEHAYIASDYGIYVSVPSDIQNLFSKLDIPEIVIEPLGTEKVYTTLWDSNQDGYVLETDNLWIGSPAGLLSYNNLTDTWNTPFVLDDNTFNNILIYPNPYMIDEDSFSNGITVKAKTSDTSGGKLEVYDFSMNKVIDIECSDYDEYKESQYCFWDGRNSYNVPVANGVYFCKYKDNKNLFWDKVIIVHTQ